MGEIMEKRKLNNFYYFMYEFIWVMLLALPIISYCLYFTNDNYTTISLVQIFNNMGFNMTQDSVLYTSFTSVLNYFGSSSSALVYFSCWLVVLSLTHIFVDILMFLPRLSEKLINKIGVDL